MNTEPVAQTPATPDRWRRIGLVCFLFVFAVVACVVSLSPGDAAKPLPAVRLPDGRTVRLEAVTFGTNHVLFEQTAWKKWLRPKMPRSWQNILGPQMQNISARSDSWRLVPWLSIEASTGGSINWSNIKVLADSGESFETRGRSGYKHRDRSVMYPNLDVFPRRDRHFSLTGTVDRLPWSIRVENPVHDRPIAEWTSAPMPATNHAAGLDFILPQPEIRIFQSRLDFSPLLEIHRAGRRLKSDYAYSWTLADATGNRGYQLPTNEPTWQIDFTIWRNASAPWNTNEFEEFEIRRIPEAGAHEIRDIAQIINGQRIDRIWLGGPGRYEIENGNVAVGRPLRSDENPSRSWSSGGSGDWELDWSVKSPWLMIDTHRVPDGQRLSLFATDADGKAVNLQASGTVGAGANILAQFEIRPSWTEVQAYRKKTGNKSQSKTLDLHRPPFTLRVAVQTNLTTQFRINPAELRHISHIKPASR
jgi:hypothetical protein